MTMPESNNKENVTVNKTTKKVFRDNDLKDGCLAALDETESEAATQEYPWILSPELISKSTTAATGKNDKKATTKIIMRRKPKAKSGHWQFINSQTKEVLYQEFYGKNDVIVTYDKDGTTLLRLAKYQYGTGLNGLYLYRTRPAFDGQEPSGEQHHDNDDNNSDKEEKTKGGDPKDKDQNDDNDDNDNDTQSQQPQPQPLYLYGRVLHCQGQKGTSTYSIFSVCKGLDDDAAESGLGYLWKDIYKVIRVPQFQYACLVVDLQQQRDERRRQQETAAASSSSSTQTNTEAPPMVLRSQQTNALDLRPTYEMAAGVDIPNAILASFPLLPDGSKVVSAIEAAEELAGLGALA